MQIPLMLLTDSATLYQRLSIDEYGNATYSGAIEITSVRVDPVQATGLDNLGEMKDDRLVLFYDCYNSNPGNVVFKALDKIVIAGEEYIIREVSSFHKHHIEVKLK